MPFDDDRPMPRVPWIDGPDDGRGEQLARTIAEVEAAFKGLEVDTKAMALPDDDEDEEGDEALVESARSRPITSVRGSGNPPLRSLPPAAKTLTADAAGDLAENLAGELFLALADRLPGMIEDALPDQRDVEGRVALRVGRHLQEALAELRDGLTAEFTAALDEAEARFTARLEEAEARYHAEMKTQYEHLARLMLNLPVPVVNLPAPVVNVAQPEPAQIFVPPDAIRITALPPPPRKSLTVKRVNYGADGRPESIEEETSEE